MLMLRPDELVIDNFAGGGGASEGIEQAIGRAIDAAVNHDPEAVAMHKANHPNTLHYCQSVWKADPREIVRDCSKARGSEAALPVGLAWFSPDCKHFSKAKGSKPVEKHIRDLAWVVVHWAKWVRPRVIMLENVEEFRDWGPLILTEDGKTIPCPVQKGFTFRRWVKELRKLGYVIEWREMRACDYGAPTIRKRLFVIARCDGEPIVWPEATHGAGLEPYKTAADCIDWSIPTPSIFERDKPLAENAQRRIANGMFRYVINSAKPFIVPVTHTGDSRVHGIDDPFRTVTSAPRGEFAVVVPTIVGCGGRAGQSRPRGGDEPMATATSKADACLTTATLMVNTSGHPGGPVDDPAHTITTGNHHYLAAATMVQTGYGERDGQRPRSLDIEKPIGTLVGTGKHAVVEAALAPIIVGAGGPVYGGKPKAVDVPFNSMTTENHACLVSAFLAQHNGGAHNDGLTGRDADAPLSTITGRGTQQQVVTSHLVKLRGTCKDGQPVTEPMPTITGGGTHVAEVRAFLIKYYRDGGQDQSLDDPMHTISTKARMGLVTVHGVDYQIVDIGMRMLTPRELYRAQGFPESYKIDFDYKGKPLSKTAQVRMCGNSVCPPMSRALVAANFNANAAEEIA